MHTSNPTLADRWQGMSFNHLAEIFNEDAVAKGFGKTSGRTFVESLALCIGELSEAIEEWRAGHAPTEVYYHTDANGQRKPEGVPVELADTIIRILQLCGEEKIDIDSAIQEKHAFNLTRPFQHGGKRI